MSNSFFLTRQTANLMEDFVREVEAGAALFLLYGDPGVGKSRLLRELRENRLAQASIHFLDFKSGDDAGPLREDRSTEVEALFATAQDGDTIIVDHFELAIQKTRHQLFLSWSNTVVDKRLNLIVASNNAGFNELRQLAQQYQIQAQSFRLMPLKVDEVRAFLGFYLFPEQPDCELVIPSQLRRQLAAADGNFARIIEIAERDGAQIEPGALVKSGSVRQATRAVVAALLLFSFAGGVGWYLYSRPAPSLAVDAPVEDRLAAESESSPVAGSPGSAEPTGGSGSAGTGEQGDGERGTDAVATMTAGLESTGGDAASTPVEEAASEVVTGAEPGEVPALAADAGMTANGGGQSPLASNDAPAAIGENSALADAGNIEEPVDGPPTDSGDGIEIDPLAAAQRPGVSASEGVLVSDDAAAGEQATVEPGADDQSAPDEEAADVSGDLPDPARLPYPQRFERDLAASLDWLELNERGVGTVQILLLSVNNFDLQNYYEFVDRLDRRGVDIAKLRIFRTLTGKQVVYSVFYGQYPSRNRAFAAIGGLPAALREMSPITRSVGGIRDEIRRLHEQTRP